MRFNEAYDPIRALQTSWKVVAQAPLPMLIGGAVLVLTNGGGGGGGNFGSSFDRRGGDFDEEMLPILIGVFGIACCLGIVFFLVSSWVKIGYANEVAQVLRAGTGDLGKVFDARGRFGSMLLSRLLCALITLVSAIPFLIPIGAGALLSDGFENDETLGASIAIAVLGGLVYLPVFAYIVLGLTLAESAVALEGARPVESVRRSWSLVAGNRLMMFWYLLATGIFSALGICACCIGVFLTGPMAEIARSESFLALTRGPERANWWIEGCAAPPPPPQNWGSPTPTSSWGSPPPPPPA